ncbi:hypothetical protein K438DRAFT_1854694 [Mycena galopus ATCC 62051]|nr:hypothetical protein K438DRAFT_1854694 [Mycena galopus ATCC 62051]
MPLFLPPITFAVECHHREKPRLTDTFTGGSIPLSLRSATDNMLYSMLSTVQANWGLSLLGGEGMQLPPSQLFSHGSGQN